MVRLSSDKILLALQALLLVFETFYCLYYVLSGVFVCACRFMDRRALYGGQEGTDVAVEILSTCRHYLQPHG